MADTKLREAYERRKLAAAPKRSERWTAKDWITMSLAVFASVVSTATAYYGGIRVVDEIRVVVEETPIIYIDLTTASITLRGDPVFVLINSGTRPAAILSVSMELGEDRKAETWEASCERGRVLDSNLEGVVIKEKEIVRKAVKLEPEPLRAFGARREQDGSVVLPLPQKNLDKEEYHIGYCLQFRIVTPSQAELLRRVVVGSTGTSGGSNQLGRHPIVLWRESGYIFTMN